MQSQCVLDAFRVQGLRGGKANDNCGNIPFNFKRSDSFPLRLHRNDDLGKKLNEKLQKFNKTENFFASYARANLSSIRSFVIFCLFDSICCTGVAISFDACWCLDESQIFYALVQ